MADLSQELAELTRRATHIDTSHRPTTAGKTMYDHGAESREANIRHATRLLPLLPATREAMVAATKLDASAVSRAMGMLRREGKVELIRGVWRVKP